MEQSPTVLDRSPEPTYEFYTSGFPFDDNMSRGRQDIRSHLEDLAQRHPEFADQLRCPPWGGEVGPSQGTWNRARQSSSGDDCSSFRHPSEQEQVEEPGPLRGRARQNNLPQHGLRNTVDLGQQQHEAEQEKGSRGQRSMSAPPDNRTSDQPQRFVSRIDINPLNPGGNSTGEGKPPVAPKQQQQQQSPPKMTNKPVQQGASNVRHIPIFVEGRDEPVISRNVDSAPEKIFSERTIPTQASFPSERVPPPQSPFVERVIPTQTTFPSERMGRPQSPFTERVIPTQTVPPQSFGFNRPSHFTSQHQFQPQHPSSVPQGKKQQQNREQPTEQQQPKAPPQPPKAPPQPAKAPPKAPGPNNPLSLVQAVEKDVGELEGKVNAYSGNSRKDKDYIYLDEMLTRNLLKLDNIETEGKENVRQARKSVIRDIQRCIGILESKVPIPEETMEVTDAQLEQQGQTESSQPECATPAGVEEGPELSTTEVPEQPVAPENEVMNVEGTSEETSQSTEHMNMEEEVSEEKPAEETSHEKSGETEMEQMQAPVKVAEEQEQVQPSCVEMTEAVSLQEETSNEQSVEESKPVESTGESVEVVGDSTSSQQNMEVDSGVTQPEVQNEEKLTSVPSANSELGSGDQPPSKAKKGSKKATGKSKKSAPQPSS
ncbi:BAG domain-containing protein Samui isoform X2 [Anabrus simplex]|uniref:BAG domain-containing protein Samui isoform X2 n=1 Tax=Anabrus simplex TaxID=316456 RepID=UPI0035A36839